MRFTSNTRQKILEAAGEVFAESGFRFATVREICRRAGVNIAAVNYHFRDKESLYIAVLKYWREVAFEKYPLQIKIDEKKSPQENLRGFIRLFLLRILEEGQHSWFGKLVAREYMEPTGALDILFEEAIIPAFSFLASVVKILLGEHAKDDDVRLCCVSVVSQCLFYVFAKPVIKRFFHQESFKTEEIEVIADHITRFSLNAIVSIGRDGKGDKK